MQLSHMVGFITPSQSFHSSSRTLVYIYLSAIIFKEFLMIYDYIPLVNTFLIYKIKFVRRSWTRSKNISSGSAQSAILQ